MEEHGPKTEYLPVIAVVRMNPFRLFLLMQFINSTIVWILATTVQWIFVESGKSGLIIALVPALLGIPFVLLALPMGVLATRWLRPRVIAVGMMLIAVACAIAAAWTYIDTEQVVVAVVALALAGIGLVATNLAWQSLLPLLVSRRGIVSAAMLDGSAFNGARAIGPLIAGVLLAVIMPDALLWGNGVLAVGCAILALNLAKADTVTPTRNVSTLTELASTLRFARYSRWTQSLSVRMVLFGVPASGLWALLPVYSRDVLGVDSSEFGFLFAATGAGAVLGSMIVGPLRARVSEQTFAGIGSSMFGVAMVGLPWATGPVFVVLFLVVSGVCWVTVQTLWVSLAQRVLPDWSRAGIIGLLFSLFQAAQVVGSVMWGAVADWLGVVVGLMIAGGVMLANAIDIFVRGIPSTRGITPHAVQRHILEPPAGLQLDQPIRVEIMHYGIDPCLIETQKVLQAVRLSRLRYGALSWDFEPREQTTDQHREVMRFANWGVYENFETMRLTVPEQRLRSQLNQWTTRDSEVHISNV